MSHGGSWQGFKAYILRFPEDRLAVAVLANLAEADPGPVSRGIMELWDPALKLLPDE
jgi:hypothetical protein